MAKHQAFQRRRPRQARSQVTYDSILQAAIQILERSGPDALNTNAIAERAGVSIGTLYQYFPDREAILLAAARRELATPAPVALYKALLEALLRAFEALLGREKARTSGAVRQRAGVKIQRRVLLEFALHLLAPPLGAFVAVPVTRPVRRY